MIIRGLPGAGKSTVAKKLADKVFEADQYFYKFDQDSHQLVYQFDHTKIGAAHQTCQRNVENAMNEGISYVAVANTFTQKKEVEPYIILAAKYGYEVQLITVQSNFKNVHDVPEESLQRMRNRWENFTLSDF